VSADGEVGGRWSLVDDGGEVAGEPVERLGLVVGEAYDEGLEQVERPGGQALARARRRHHHGAGAGAVQLLRLRLCPHGRRGWWWLVARVRPSGGAGEDGEWRLEYPAAAPRSVRNGEEERRAGWTGDSGSGRGGTSSS